MFLPTTPEELKKLGWDKLDIILVTGDAYVDSSFIGAAVIGQVLLDAGYRVGIIGQPDVNSDADITRLGEPALFWGITAGAIDSMIANYTALMKPKRLDDLTPGELNNKRPDRATIVYANLIKKHFKNTKPLVLGGLEASLRRIAHYDYWDDAVRRSILFDAKADILVYGMGEKAVLALADRFKRGQTHGANPCVRPYDDVKGICYIANEPKPGYTILPSYEEAKNDKMKFTEMFQIFYANNDPVTANGLCQQQDTRYLIQNPPAETLSVAELDRIYDLDYERDAHPFYKNQGQVKALATIRFSITSHRGCYGECNFCALTEHQGRNVVSRSPESIVREAEIITRLPDFKGYILDVGGPTANMYGIECDKKGESGACANKRCLYPMHCARLGINHHKQIELLRRLRQIPGIKKVFIGSGIRYDMILSDRKCGPEYLKELVEHHISGQLKIAPEHTEYAVLKAMGKARQDHFKQFKDDFYRCNQELGQNQFLTYYFIAAHPGCSYEDMGKLNTFIKDELKMRPEQVQIFTPIPSTYSALMYYTEMNPFTYQKIFVEKDLKAKRKQKDLITAEDEN